MNSSSTLKSQVLTFGLLEISIVKVFINSISSYISKDPTGVGIPADWKILLAADLVEFTKETWGSPPKIGT